MAHSIVKVENKTPDWKVVEILNAAGDLITGVSVNRTNKKGEVFPEFDSIVAGAKIEGQLWESPAGKTYLFAPKGGRVAPRPDMGPASKDAGLAELKNILMLKVVPLLMQIDLAVKELQGNTPKYPEYTGDPTF